MGLTMADKPTNSRSSEPWPAKIRDEFEREAKNQNGCVGHKLISKRIKFVSGGSVCVPESGSVSTGTFSTISGRR